MDKTIDSPWNVGGLRKEITRLTMRAHKKVAKANQRLTKATAEVERLTSDPDVSTEELETCPNLEELQTELTEIQDRLKKLNQLEVLLVDVKGNNVVLLKHVAELALELEVNDEPQKRPARPAKQEKGPRKMESFRVPYRRFYSENKTEIRVSTGESFHLFQGHIKHVVDADTFLCVFSRSENKPRITMSYLLLPNIVMVPTGGCMLRAVREVT